MITRKVFEPSSTVAWSATTAKADAPEPSVRLSTRARPTPPCSTDICSARTCPAPPWLNVTFVASIDFTPPCVRLTFSAAHDAVVVELDGRVAVVARIGKLVRGVRGGAHGVRGVSRCLRRRRWQRSSRSRQRWARLGAPRSTAGHSGGVGAVLQLSLRSDDSLPRSSVEDSKPAASVGSLASVASLCRLSVFGRCVRFARLPSELRLGSWFVVQRSAPGVGFVTR